MRREYAMTSPKGEVKVKLPFRPEYMITVPYARDGDDLDDLTSPRRWARSNLSDLPIVVKVGGEQHNGWPMITIYAAHYNALLDALKAYARDDLEAYDLVQLAIEIP